MKDDLEELSIAARRGELPRSDTDELERLLSDAPDERIWLRAGQRFDAEDTPQPGDEEIAQRLLLRVLAPRPSLLPRRRRKLSVVLLAAAAVSVAAAAAAVMGIGRLRGPFTAPVVTHVAAPATSPAEPRVEPAPKREPDVEPEAPPTELEAPASAEVAPVDRMAAKSEQVPETAAGLLSSAGQARRKGQAERAITLLEALQSRFPSSAEARASDITLGMMRLQLGASSAALKDFDRYLGRSPAGDRAADALWGRSKALLSLKRRSEAEASLRLLLTRYPSSPLASAARAELHQVPP